MKSNLIYLVLLLTLCACGQKSTSKVHHQKNNVQDLRLIVGEWTGTLTYVDYRTNKPYTMPANLIVQEGETKYQFVLNNIYPNEPAANDSDKLSITEDGKFLNSHAVISRSKLETGEIQIKTEYMGEDNNKKALIHHTYLIGTKSFSNKKEVQYLDSKKWILRSEFNYKRKE